MLRKHIQWRELVQYDQISSWDLPDDLHGLLPQGFIGYDDNNFPILLALVGRWNAKKIVQGTSREDAVKPHWKSYDSMKKRMKGKFTKEGVPVTQMSAIVDLSELSLLQGTLQVFRALSDFARGFEANFPELLKTCVVINSPWFLPMFFKFIKPFLSPKTTDKIQFYGYNRDEWVEALRKIFPESSLPTIYGGTNDNYKIS
ncbi:unnamed protein product [Allacma fusca]|uniref:CRAL-TRIO domain-containing protein n=1 Tax=Allacma fusca TaxID=39272 RepID=A0A8J2KFT9_9HEXA|nr:unnamed protein product [Allacma fusca]